MPRTKAAIRHHRHNSSQVEQASVSKPALPSKNRKSRFRGLRLALPGLHGTTSTSIPPSQPVAIVSTKSSIVTTTNHNENVSVQQQDSTSTWAKWSQADPQNAVVDENANAIRKKPLIPKSIKIASPRKRPSASTKNNKSNNIDNSRYILAVNQGRRLVQPDPPPNPQRTHSPQKPVTNPSVTMTPTMEIDPPPMLRNVEKSDIVPLVETRSNATTFRPEIPEPETFHDGNHQHHHHHHHLSTERKLTEYEYYQQRSAHGGRLGIEERIDVFEPKMVSQQKFIGDDELESIQLRPALRRYHDDDDDDTTTVAETMPTSTRKGKSGLSVITQSPTQSTVGMVGRRATILPNSNHPYEEKEIESKYPYPSTVQMEPVINTTTFPAELSNENECGVSLNQSRTDIPLEEEQHIRSQVNRLIELKNSAEFLNVISSQVSHNNHMKHYHAAAVVAPPTIACSEILENFNAVNVTAASKSPSLRPVMVTHQQASTEAEEIDRLLAVLDPITRALSKPKIIPTHQDIMTPAISAKALPLPTQRHPDIQQPQQPINELGSQYSGSSDGEFYEKLKAEAFAAFDDENDEDVAIANPYLTADTFPNEHSTAERSHHQHKPAVRESGTDRSNLWNEHRSNILNEHQGNHFISELSTSQTESSDQLDDEIVTQFFQTDFDKVDFEIKFEESLQAQGIDPFSLTVDEVNDDNVETKDWRDKNLMTEMYCEKSSWNPQNSHAQDHPSLNKSTNDKIAIEGTSKTRKFSQIILQPSSTTFIENDKIRVSSNQNVAKSQGQFNYTPKPQQQHGHKSPSSLLENTFPNSNSIHPLTRPDNTANHRGFVTENSKPAGAINSQTLKARNYSNRKTNHGTMADYSRPNADAANNMTKIAREPSPQLEKQGYASAPIRKYWQQYSNVRSGGSFDTLSLRNEGSDESSFVEANNGNLQRSNPGSVQVTNVPLKNVPLASTKEVLPYQEPTITSDHIHEVANDRGVEHTEVIASLVNDNALDQQQPHHLTTPWNKDIESISFKNDEPNSSARSERKVNGSLDHVCLIQHSGENSNWQHQTNKNQVSVSQRVPRSGTLYDDEGLSVHQHPVPSIKNGLPINSRPDFDSRRNIASQQGHVNEQSEANIPVVEIPRSSETFVEQGLNSPETEFLMFTTASQLATQDFNIRVERAISPTKDAASVRVVAPILFSESNDGVNNNSVHNMISVTPKTRYKKSHKDASRERTSDEICTFENPHDTPNDPRSVQPTSYQDRQYLLPSVNRSTWQLESDQFDHKADGLVCYQEENLHIQKKYPSFDSDIAIADDIIEVLSVTSSEEARSMQPLAIGSDSEKEYVDIMQRLTIPILPPWQSANDIASDTAPNSYISVQSQHSPYNENNEMTRRAGRPQPGALDTTESVYSKDLPSPLRDTLIHAMSPMLSGDSHDEDTVSEWSSRYDQSRAGYSESFHQQYCSFLACFDISTLEEQLRYICGYKRD